MPLLTPEQLEQLRKIIRDASTSVAISTTGMAVSDDELQRLVEAGYVDPKDLQNVVLDSFELGRIMAAVPAAKGWTFEQLKGHLEKQPVEMSPQERLAVDHLQARAGQFCVGLGTRAEGDLTLAAADMDQELADAFRLNIQNEAAQSIARRETVGRLTTRLRQMSDDWARDWGRIASTESQMAHQAGYTEATAKRYGAGARMAKIPEPTACPDCLRLYLDEDGKPRLETVEWWQSQGVANYGLKRADWKPVLGAVHPWCMCQLSHAPDGWEFDENWDLVPIEEGAAEKSLRPTPKVQALRKSRKLHYRTTFRGLPISIENRKGSIRRWHDPHTDTEGKTRMRLPYGYIRLTEGEDGDHVDCFLGPHEDATHVYVIHQRKAPHFDEPDEDKVMLGQLSASRAKRAYLQHFNDPRFFGSMDAIPIERFVERVLAGKYRDGKRIEKAGGTFGGSAGLVGTTKPVGTMGNAGSPARTAGQNTYGAQPAADHPCGPDARSKRAKERKARQKTRISARKKRRIEEEKRRVSANPVKYTDGYVRAKPRIDLDLDSRTADNRQWLDDEQERRARRAGAGRLTLRPQNSR